MAKKDFALGAGVGISGVALLAVAGKGVSVVLKKREEKKNREELEKVKEDLINELRKDGEVDDDKTTNKVDYGKGRSY